MKPLLFVGSRSSDLELLARGRGYAVVRATWQDFLSGDPTEGVGGVVLLAEHFPLPTLPPHVVLQAVRRRLDQGLRAFAEASVLFQRPDGVKMTSLDNQRVVLPTGRLLDPHQTLVCSVGLPTPSGADALGEGMERADDVPVADQPWAELGVVVGTHTRLQAHDLTPVLGVVHEGRRQWLVSRLRLSCFQTDLFAPGNAWQDLAGEVLAWLLPPGQLPLRVTTSKITLPRRGAAPLSAWSGQTNRGITPAEAKRAVRGLARWFKRSGILPSSDGHLGVTERFMTEVTPGGRRLQDWSVRTDCTMHTVVFFDRLAQLGLSSQPRLPANLVGYLVEQGYQDDEPSHATEGFWQWGRGHGGRAYAKGEVPEDIYANDQAWVLLGLCSVAPLGLPGLEQRLERTARALYQTQGTNGLRERCLRGSELNSVGRTTYGQGAPSAPSGHFDGMALAALLQYGLTRAQPDYVALARKGLETLAQSVLAGRRPELPLSLTSDNAYCLPGLSLAVLHLASAVCRAALEQVTASLLLAQHACGAFVEQGNPVEDLARRSGDVGVFTGDSDLIVDLLYSQPPLALYLPLAAKALNSPQLKQAGERLLGFLATVQIHSSQPSLDGAYQRAFSIPEWDYFGYNADFKWGPTVTESGWTCALIGAAFAQYLLGEPFLGGPSSGQTVATQG